MFKNTNLEEEKMSYKINILYVSFKFYLSVKCFTNKNIDKKYVTKATNVWCCIKRNVILQSQHF